MKKMKKAISLFLAMTHRKQPHSLTLISEWTVVNGDMEL